MHEEFSSSDESHNEEDLLFSLENVMHANQEWVISLHQNLFFQFSALNLVIIYDDILSQRFHSEDFAGIFFLDQEYFTEATSSDDFPD